MSDVATLLTMKRREFHNRVHRLKEQSRLKAAVVIGFGLAVWFGLYWLFRRGFWFLRVEAQGPVLSQFLMQHMLALFFFALTLMLVFSNAIILYGALYRSRETFFLMAAPVRPVTLFFYRLGESVAFSSWAFLFLVTPLLAAYGQDLGLGLPFYGAAFGLVVLFVVIPASLGALATMGLAAFFPRSKRTILALLVAVCLLAGSRIAAEIVSARRAAQDSGELTAAVMFGKLQALLHPLLPSTWIASGIVDAGNEGREAEVFRAFRLILSNALFFLLLAALAAKAFLMRGWWACQGLRYSRRYREGPLWRWLVRPCLAPLGPQVKLLVVKDLKNFLRDPVQWSQFLIFFGLLAIYFANLRTFQYNQRMPFWRNLIAQLNLAATCLTLSTFTSRFVFPQLSLEGRRFWIIGMVPMTRRQILVGKFLFAAGGALAVCLSLIVLSNWMLDIPTEVVWLQVVSVTGMCVGLSGLAVGLGALYPNFHEDNPSKIVSGFGGTLNLVLSLALVVVVLALEAFPCTLYMTGRLRLDLFPTLSAAFGVAILAVSALAAAVPFWLGARAFDRMEA